MQDLSCGVARGLTDVLRSRASAGWSHYVPWSTPHWITEMASRVRRKQGLNGVAGGKGRYGPECSGGTGSKSVERRSSALGPLPSTCHKQR